MSFAVSLGGCVHCWLKGGVSPSCNGVNVFSVIGVTFDELCSLIGLGLRTAPCSLTVTGSVK